MTFFRIDKDRSFFTNAKNSYEHITRSTYTWTDQSYREFMMEVLRNLEPKFERQGSIIIDELDEFDEIIFCHHGQVYLGYEINKQRRFCIKYT